MIAGAGFALGRLFRGDFVGAAAEAGGILVPGPISGCSRHSDHGQRHLQ